MSDRGIHGVGRIVAREWGRATWCRTGQTQQGKEGRRRKAKEVEPSCTGGQLEIVGRDNRWKLDSTRV
jgi:hypothetical protein